MLNKVCHGEDVMMYIDSHQTYKSLACDQTKNIFIFNPLITPSIKPWTVVKVIG